MAGTDVSTSILQGFAIEDPRLRETTARWAAQDSGLTQAGPIPGDAEAQGDYEMMLQTSGTQAASSALRVLTLDGGHPGPGGAGYVWRDSTDATTAYRGWDPPGMIHDWRSIVWTDGGATITSTRDPHALALDDGTCLVAVQQRDSVEGETQLAIWALDKDAFTWSERAQAYTQAAVPGERFSPCLVLMDDGAILAFHWVEDTGQSKAQIRVHRSTDNGTTWAVASSSALPASIDISSTLGAGNAGYDLKKIRAAQVNGQVLLLAEIIQHNTTAGTYTHKVRQYASDSEGNKFTLIEESANSVGVGYPEVIAYGDGFLIAYIPAGSNQEQIKVLDLPHAFFPVSSASTKATINAAVTVAQLDTGTTTYLSDGDLSMVVDDAGILYILARLITGHATVHEQGAIWRSVDGGTTWGVIGTRTITSANLGTWWDAGQNTAGATLGTYPTNFSAAFSQGRLIVACNHVASPGNEDDSLSAFVLGGYGNVTMPGLEDAKVDTGRVSWSVTWVPFEEPGDLNVWTAAGAGTDTLANGRLEVATAANQRTYTLTPAHSGTIAEGQIVEAIVACTGGGSLTTDEVAIRMVLGAGGVNSYGVKLRLRSTPDTMRLVDDVSGATIGSDMSVNFSEPVQVRIAIGDTSAQVWWRQAGDLRGDRQWTAGPSTTSLTDGGAGANVLAWGHLANAAVTAASRWYMFAASHDADNGTGLHDAYTNPDHLFARYYAGSGYATWLDAGVRITGIGGPARRGETYHIDTAYSFPVERMMLGESPTPRVRWRSTGTGAHKIAFALDATLLATVEHHALNDTMAFGFFGCNWRTGTIEGYDVDTVAWVTVATINASDGLTGLSYARQGNTIRPSTSNTSTNTPYLWADEYKDGYVSIGGVKFRKIAAHSEGHWVDTTTKIPTLYLSGVDNTEGTSGNKNLIIVPKNFVVVVNLLGASYAGFRLVIDSQSNPDGYFEIGNILMGPVAYFGQRYATGWQIETARTEEQTISADRVRRVREVAPISRAWEVAWDDLWRSDQATGTGDVDFLKASTTGGALPVATSRDPFLLEQLLSLSGVKGHAIMLPGVAKVVAAGDTIILNRRGEFILGWIEGPVTRKNYAGNENDDEVVTLSTVTFREIV